MNMIDAAKEALRILEECDRDSSWERVSIFYTDALISLEQLLALFDRLEEI